MPGMRLEAPRVQDNQPDASAYDMYITAGCTFMVSILLYNVVHNLQFEDLEYRIWRWATWVVILVDILLGMYRKRITRAEICAYWSGLFLFLTVDVHVINYLGEVLCWNVTKVAAMMAVTACESAVIVYVWAHVRGIAHKRDKGNKGIISMATFLCFVVFFLVNMADTYADQDPVCTVPVSDDTNRARYVWHVYGRHALVVGISMCFMYEYCDTFMKNLADPHIVTSFWQTDNLPKTIVTCIISELDIQNSFTGMVFAALYNSDSVERHSMPLGRDTAGPLGDRPVE